MARRIDLTDANDRWQWACPAGHRTWEPTNHHWWSPTCARYWDEAVEPEFDELRNLRTGETVTRDQVELVDEFGLVETVQRRGA